ncbi:VOC family protein [Phytomonospora endophytica]|uniref:Putative enzyme related to lactoylglutathione lyase n=1 Tax=Phytomonospora endophytica TaxID=714109 RepID=A0A841FMH1_9ACTN|nr:VOC family protein [Phytomonospora endophytica]MBB6037054.1 putative enzyme related to lactoylglutathione lyase [Phytomonospora endophytica]GIG69403.1 glyoxalase [Phytomonospora endophytica]
MTETDESRGISPERWNRKDWWGVVIDTDDVETLTLFYSRLRGWRIWKMDTAGSALDLGEGAGYLGVQHNPAYVRPVWPAPEGAQQMMLHLDFQVTDLEAETARAVELGAELPEHQPQDDVRVLLDPAGHPFCLYT